MRKNTNVEAVAQVEAQIRVFIGIFGPTMSARSVRKRKVYEKEIGKFNHRCCGAACSTFFSVA
jgi:sigma54-dependent transcription regulator